MRRMTGTKLAKGHTLYVDDNPRDRSRSLFRAPSRPALSPRIHHHFHPLAVAPFLPRPVPLPSAEQTTTTLLRSVPSSSQCLSNIRAVFHRRVNHKTFLPRVIPFPAIFHQTRTLPLASIRTRNLRMRAPYRDKRTTELNFRFDRQTFVCKFFVKPGKDDHICWSKRTVNPFASSAAYHVDCHAYFH